MTTPELLQRYVEDELIDSFHVSDQIVTISGIKRTLNNDELRIMTREVEDCADFGDWTDLQLLSYTWRLRVK